MQCKAEHYEVFLQVFTTISQIHFFRTFSVTPSVINFKIKKPLLGGIVQNLFLEKLFCVVPIICVYFAILLKDEHKHFPTVSTNLVVVANCFVEHISVVAC